MVVSFVVPCAYVQCCAAWMLSFFFIHAVVYTLESKESAFSYKCGCCSYVVEYCALRCCADCDVLVGHNILGFDLGVLLHRAQFF
jgi:hypothetical protein